MTILYKENIRMTQKGKIFFVSGPSGVGKGTLIAALKERHPEWVFPPSYSTREMRSGEAQGNPYYFIPRSEFEAKIIQEDFLEYAFIHEQDFYLKIQQVFQVQNI